MRKDAGLIKWAMIMLFCLLASFVICTAALADSNGECGANLTWTLTDDGLLTISGTGAMTSYSWNASEVKQVYIEDGVTSIESCVFEGYSSLTSITIPEGVTSIRSGAFAGCSSLTSITIPNGVTSIEYSTFNGCSSLTNIIIPDSVTSIEDYAFNDCSSLASITIPSSVTSIGSSTFYGCSSLVSVTIPDSVTSIGSSTFNGCSSLVSVTIPDSVTSIGSSAFSRCSSLVSITIPDSVTSIGGAAFSFCSSLTSITIPEGVTSIERAFYGCSSLTSITIPNSITSIGDTAFCECSSLTSITIPDSVTSIGSSAFSGCSSLTSITIPDSVTSIGYRAFYGCSSLTSIAIPESVTSIGDSAFEGCSSLTSIYCYTSSYAESWAIENVLGDKMILISHSLTSIAAQAATCTEAGNSAYWKCSECNKYFSDASGETEIAENSWVIAATGHSWNTPTYTWSEDYSSVTATRTCKNGNHPETESVTTSRKLVKAPTEKEAGSYQMISSAFENTAFEIQTQTDLSIPALASMSVLTLPSNLKTIETGAFEGIAAEAIIIPDGCTAIASKAFIYCKNLIYVRIPAGITVSDDASDGCPNVMIDQK